jgi:hypothetical protein
MPKKKRKPKDNISHFLLPSPKSDCLTIKTSLKSVLLNYDRDFTIINQLVLDSQEIVVRTYLFIRLFILHKYYANETIPDVDKDFVMYCIRTLGTRDNRGRLATDKALQKELNNFYDTEFQPLLDKPKFTLVNKTYLIPYLAIQIQTGFNNNIKEHFITRIRRFMNIFQPELIGCSDEKAKNKLLNQIKNSVLLDKIKDKCPLAYQKWANDIRMNYLPETYEESFFYDAKCHPNKYLNYTIKMNNKIEEMNDEIDNQILETNNEDKIKELQTNKKKLFQPIPLRRSCVPGYITIDTNVILSTFGVKGESNLNKDTKKKFRHIWLKVFNIDKGEFKKNGYHFTSIQTDGVGVSIIFEKDNITKKNIKKSGENIKTDTYLDELSDEDLNVLKHRKIVSVDPGKSVLSQMMGEDGTTLRYTACQRRMESLAKRNKNILWREQNKFDIQKMESELSDQNSKTVNYDKFKKYIREKIKLNDKIINFYQDQLFRKLKWRTQIYRRKSEDKFLNRIEETYGSKEDIIICYGDWSNNRQMKNIMPTMGKGMRKIVSKKFDLALINEYKSSKLCHKCYCELENYKGKHRVLMCKGCSGLESKKTTFINRDINACYNIMTIAKDWIESKKRRDEFKPDKLNDDLIK